MKSSYPVAGVLTALSLFGFAADAGAAEWYPGPAAARFAGKPDAAATAYLEAFAKDLALEHVHVQRVDVLQVRDLRTVRFEQRYHGLPVFGSLVSVRVAPDGAVRSTMLDVARGLTVSPAPAVDEAHAVAVVAAALGHATGPYAAQLGVRPQRDLGGLLVWHIDVMDGAGMRRFVVDAHGGRLLFDYPMARNALGRVYAVNEQQTPTLIDAELLGLNTADPSRLDGFDLGLSVYGYKSGDITYDNVAVKHDTGPNAAEDFLYEPNSSVTSLDDPFGEVMSYYHAARMRAYFEDTFGLDMTASKYSLAVVTSYAPSSSPEYIENAFYTPWVQGYGSFPGDKRNAVFLGRGYVEDFAYDSDVLLHEYTHYINHNAMKFSSMGLYDQYGFLSMPGAINEGTADYFSATLNDDPVVGEVALSHYARDLSEPSGRCPESMWGESHEDGKLIGTTGWALRGAFGAALADQLMWGAMSGLGGGAALGDLADGIVQTATDLGLDATQMQTIQTILADRGLDACGRALLLEPGLPVTTNVFGLDILGQYWGVSCGELQSWGMIATSIFQFEAAPQSTDEGLKIEVDLDMLMGGGKLDWNLYVRRGQMVTLTGFYGYDMPEVTGFDYVVENISSSHGELVIDDASDPPFDPSEHYYVLLVTDQCPMVAARIKASPLNGTVEADAGADAPPPWDASNDGATPGDAGPGFDAKPPATDGGIGQDGGAQNLATPDPLDIGGGCGCRVPTAPDRTGVAAALIALAAGLLLRRRRG